MIDPNGLFGVAGIGISMGIGALIGMGVGGGISYIGGGNSSDIFWAAGNGAILGAVGGAIYPILGAASSFSVGLLGLSTTSALWTSVIGTNVLTGMVIGMLDAYMANKDIFEGAATGMIFGLLFSPIGVYGNQISNQFKTAWRVATQKTMQVVGDFFHAGRGKPVGLGRKLLRTFWEDRQTFNASKEFLSRWRNSGIELKGWSLEHMIIKQRWYKEGGPNAVANPILRTILRGIGNSGVNLFPVPMSWNTYFHHHLIQGTLFNYGTYAGAIAVEYIIYKVTYDIGTAFWNDVFSPENED
jgi:hypothetical protein